MQTTGGIVKQNPPLWHSFTVFFSAIEAIIVLLYGFCIKYPQWVSINSNTNAAGSSVVTFQQFGLLYPLYQDVHVMAFIGLALLCAYLKHSGWTHVGVHFLVAIVTVQVYILFRIFWFAITNNQWEVATMDFIDILTADYCVAAVTVTWAALSGRIGPCQMLLIAIVEAFLYAILEQLAYNWVKVYDIGGSFTVWAFGAAWGLGAGLVNQADKTKVRSGANETSHHYGTLFAIIGTLFLWVFFPSWNAARVHTGMNYGLQYGAQSLRAVVNTLLSMTGSCLLTFIVSPVFADGKFDIDHILKATLAGGVIIGASADLCTQPWAAILIGAWGAFMAICFFKLFHERTKFIDTLGVTHLFLWPGLWGGGISAIYVGWMTTGRLGVDPTTVFWNNRTPNAQGGAQLAICGICAGVGIIGGLITGLIVKLFKCYKPLDEHNYDDQDLWAPDKDELTR
jgi:ammonium transporter Rh